MKVLLASLFLMGFMSCAHHHGKGHDHSKNHDEKCADGSCELKGTKSCCQKEKQAES